MRGDRSDIDGEGSGMFLNSTFLRNYILFLCCFHLYTSLYV